MENAGARMRRRLYKGFTLVELMVTVAVVAILAAIAVPNLRIFIVRNALTSVTSELRSALARARVDAITRNTNVSVAPTSTSGSGPTRWLDGYVIFTNPLSKPSLDVSGTNVLGTAGTDKKIAEVLTRGEFRSDATVQVWTSGSGALVTYTSAGRIDTTLTNGTVTLCVDQTVVPTDNKRVLTVANDGRVTVATQTGAACP
jgi:prepilin-type N-terminal cleavage/methylation domain-containing protein